MRNLLSSFAVLSLLAVQQAEAQLQCLKPPERAAVEIAALRSELMVLATGCHYDENYNAFIRKYQPELMGNEKTIGEMFQHKYGRRGQQEHDRFTTDLANAEFDSGPQSGLGFLRAQRANFPGGPVAAKCRGPGQLCRRQGLGAAVAGGVHGGRRVTGEAQGRARRQASLTGSGRGDRHTCCDGCRAGD